MVCDRWDMLHSHMHCAGYVLDPECVEHNCTANQVCFCIQVKSHLVICLLCPYCSYEGSALDSELIDEKAVASLKLEPRESPVSDPTPGAPKKSSPAPACPVSAAVLRHHSRHAYPGAPQGPHHPLMHGLPPGLGSPRSLTTPRLTWWDQALGYPRKWPAWCSLEDIHCGAHQDCLGAMAAQAAMSPKQARGRYRAVMSRWIL